MLSLLTFNSVKSVRCILVFWSYGVAQTGINNLLHHSLCKRTNAPSAARMKYWKKKDKEMFFSLQLQSFIIWGFHFKGVSNYFVISFLEDNELLLHYLNNSAFLSWNHQLIVAPWKFDVLKFAREVQFSGQIW